MKDRYFDLIDQTFYWPTLHFDIKDYNLTFHGIPLMDVVKKYGTPFKITYLPNIGEQVDKAYRLFDNAREKIGYKGKYTYCYCTKSSHFSFVLEEVLKHNAHLETSSGYDMDILENLYKKDLINKDTYIICNGFKKSYYLDKISSFINNGFHNTYPILDSMNELDEYLERVNRPFNIGIRIASEEEPNFEFYTSRLGIRYADILNFYKKKIHDDPRIKLKMLHFFINTGIKDTAYYWSELNKCINIYCDLKEICPELDSFDIGGGFPVPNSLSFDYDYQYMVEEILSKIKNECNDRGIEMPHIFTEFGSYTVAESGAHIFSILNEKQQNDAEFWYMIDNSFITAVPDTWGIGQRFILLAVNHWDEKYQRVNLGGLTCDSQDYYNSEVHINQVFLPKFRKEDPLVIGLFNTGAYQDSLSGYGGIKHCLIPSPQHIIVDKDEEGNFVYTKFAEEQSSESMMKILGYLEK